MKIYSSSWNCCISFCLITDWQQLPPLHSNVW